MNLIYLTWKNKVIQLFNNRNRMRTILFLLVVLGSIWIGGDPNDPGS